MLKKIKSDIKTFFIPLQTAEGNITCKANTTRQKANKTAECSFEHSAYNSHFIRYLLSSY